MLQCRPCRIHTLPFCLQGERLSFPKWRWRERLIWWDARRRALLPAASERALPHSAIKVYVSAICARHEGLRERLVFSILSWNISRSFQRSCSSHSCLLKYLCGLLACSMRGSWSHKGEKGGDPRLLSVATWFCKDSRIDLWRSMKEAHVKVSWSFLTERCVKDLLENMLGLDISINITLHLSPIDLNLLQTKTHGNTILNGCTSSSSPTCLIRPAIILRNGSVNSRI